MNKKTIRTTFLILALGTTWLSSCRQNTTADCDKKLKDEIRPGVAFEVAEAKLKECGFKTIYDRQKNTLYGDRLKEGLPVAERTQVVIDIDTNGRVAQMRLSRGLIGP